VTVAYPPDTNATNNMAQENIDVQPQPMLTAGTAVAFGGTVSRHAHRFAFPVTMCVEPTAPVPFRTAAACICKKDLPPGADAWLEPEPPFDLMPGQCQPCSLIIAAPETVAFSPGDAVYVNGWFWGNGVAEGGVTVYYASPPPLEATVAEIQYTDDPIGSSPLLGQTVTVSGIATAGSDTYPERIAIQDGEGPWSGIFARDPGIVLRGDEVTVTGTVAETGGLTEIYPVNEIVIESNGNPLPVPEVLAPGVIGASESYEGVLVEAEDVTVVNDDPLNWQIASDGTCWVGHWGGYMYMPLLGEELNVTGVVGSLEELLKLQPRDDEDIEPATGAPDELPAVVSLSQNLPNPFSGATGISYTLPSDCDVVLQVYNVAGKLVRTLVNGRQPAGQWTIAWDGMDDGAHAVSSGVYFYSLKAAGKTVAKRMVLIE
jgi:hypothetical protein